MRVDHVPPLLEHPAEVTPLRGEPGWTAIDCHEIANVQASWVKLGLDGAAALQLITHAS